MLSTLPSNVRAAEKPELTRIFPSGGQAGTAVDVETSGKFASWPVQLGLSDTGITANCNKESGKLQVKIASDTKPGLYWMRMYNEAGASTAKPFLVGSFPESLETEPNNQPKEANKATLPSSVHGVLGKRGDVDLYAIELKKGTTFVASIDAVNWLQSAADITLQIIDQNGFVLAENLDHVGLDPYLDFNAPQDGIYCIRVFGFPANPDSTIAFGGGADWIYRLQLGTQPDPFAKTIQAPAPQITQPAFQEIPRGLHATPESSLDVSVPAYVAGSIFEPKRSEFLRFQASAGKQYRMRLTAREFGSEMDPNLTVADAKGKQLAQVDDVGSVRDPELKWKAPADGVYTIQINDFHRNGGPRFRYQACLEEYIPKFSATVGSDVLDLTVGKEAEVTVTIEREPEMQNLLHIELDPKPDTIACEVAESKHGTDTAKKAVLKLTASQAIQTPVQIVVKDKVTNTRVSVSAPLNKPLWLSAVAK
jgi:hypothetical protein